MSSLSEKLELFRTLHAGDAPLDLVLAQAARIAASVDLPVSVDFEAGYSASFGGIWENVQRLIAAGFGDLAAACVRRISYGPLPWRAAMASLTF